MYNHQTVHPFRITAFLAIACCALASAGETHAQTDTAGLEDAARATVQEAWEKEIRPYRESALTRIGVHAVQRRNRLARGVYLVQALAEASWRKHSEHYLLLMRAGDAGIEVLYRFSGGQGGKGVEFRLIDLGSRRFALEISDHGFEDEDTTGTWTVLVLYLPESDRFVEVFRELTNYRSTSPHGYDSTLSFRAAGGALKDVVVNTELLKDGKTVDRIESVFVWQDSAYQGTMPLPEDWRAELPARVEGQAPVPEKPDSPENPPDPIPGDNP